jgi:hypothetical protein
MGNAFESRRGEAQVIEVDFGPIPENPSNASDKDIKALEEYYKQHPDQFPSEKDIDVREWENWRNISIRYNEDDKKWTVSYRGFFKDEDVIQELDNEEKVQQELDKLKNYNKQIALDLIREARNFAIGEDLDTPWTNPVDLGATTVIEPESATSPAEEEQSVDVETPNLEVVEEQDEESPLENDELLNLPELEALQAELDRLIEVEAQKLQRDQNAEHLPYRIDQKKLENFKGNARKTIADYQKFASEHSSPVDKSNPQIKERSKLFEIQAWNSLYNLAHLLDGEIAILPQDRDIQLSHPGGIDTRQYLESRGYKFDGNGDITHITDNGVEIELNRAMKTDSLIKSRRPAHIVYPNPLRSSSISNDIREGFQRNVSIGANSPDRSWARPIENDTDLDKYNNVDRPTYYHSYITKGYLVKGLNQNTPDFITTILNQDMIGDVLVDETSKPNNTSEAIQDPWSAESSGETEFEKIFAASLSRNKEAQRNNEIPDPWVEKAKATNTETTEQSEGAEDLPIYNPDRGSLYYQEIQLWNNIQALENRQKENPKDDFVKSELYKVKQAYQEFRSTVSNTPEQDKFKKFLELRELYAQAESENTRGRIQKLFRLKKKNNSELEDIRSQYNEALEALLKTETSIGVEVKIKEMFSDEVQRLSGERVVQTKELQEKNQSRLDRALNPLKDRIFNWYIKNKGAVGAVNLGLFATSTFLAFTGAGIPLAGAVNTLRHTIAYPMAAASGISGRELIRSKFEDGDINFNTVLQKFKLKANFGFLKFKGGITKLVDESLQDNYIQNASDEDLSKLVSTLESYYGLNGGKFTELNQQKAYEMGLNELGARLEGANNQSADEQDISSESNVVDGLGYKFDFKNTKEFKIKTVDGIVNRISQDRILALNAQKNKRLVANVAGTALGGSLLFNLVAQDLQFNKPSLGDSVSTTGESRPKIPTTDSTPDTQAPGAGPSGSGTPEAGAVAPPEATPPPAPELPSPKEDLLMRQAAAAANEAREVLAQDVSSLDSGETIWGEIAKQLGENATDTQIQQVVENYLQSELGQESVYKLAQGTEDGRELLAQWGIDNADAMASLSKEQLFEISKYLAPGELEGLTELSLDNLDALEQAEYLESSPVVEPTVESADTQPPASPSGTEAPASPPAPEVPQVASTEFTKGVSEVLGTNSLTEAQLQEVIYSFATSEQGSVELYNQIISNEEGARFLSGFGVNNPADFISLTPDQIYEIAQTVGVENLDKLPGFELNEIILSKFEDAPDMVELARGTRPLDIVQRYIAGEVGNLPYDSNLGKQVLDTYVQTDAGKQWLYDAIVSNPNPNNQNVQLFREYLSFKGIKSAEDFKELFNWAEFSGNRNIPTSAFWNQIRLPNGGARLQPLSTFLQPSKMPGIKDAVRQVLTR